MNKYIGSNFDDFLQQEGLLAKVKAVALKRVLSFQFQQEMERRMLEQAARALGKTLKVELA